MIFHLKAEISATQATQMARALQAQSVQEQGQWILVTHASMKQCPDPWQKWVETSFVMASDIQLASREYQATKREIPLGPGLSIGGTRQETLMISGPCSVESESQVMACAEFIKSLGIKVFRGGCYKPRTSPYTFQGLGLDGLKLLNRVREKFGLLIISEVRDASHVDAVIEHVDIVQIGAKAMYDHGILRRCGESRKPILLKRGFGSTLQELVQAAEFILSLGNPHVILCERGIRTFETKTRFTLDLCGVAYLKAHINLPVVLDTSHAMGYRYGVPDLTRACVAMGVDGLLIESHPNPREAWSDSAQQLDFESFKALNHSLPPVAEAVGWKMK